MKHGRVGITIATTILVIAACSKKESADNQPAQENAAPVEAAAPSIVIAMIDAHGGMAPWRSAKTVSFEDEAASPVDSAMTSRVMVEQSRRRAYIDFPGTDRSIVWDGKRAWSMNWNRRTPPRFLALLNYYFLNLPWLTMDPGVKLSVAGTDTLWNDPTQYHSVKMTFMPGTGDTPRDTYRLYIDPESRRLKACAYTVTYRSLLPDSMESTPEHILVYDEYTTVDGLVVPSRYTIYSTAQDTLYACRVRDWAFGRPFDEARMTMPEGAVMDESTP